MDESVFRFIWRYSKRDQIWILAIVLLSLPFYFLSLDLPKTIVNKAIQGDGFEETGTLLAFYLGLPEGWWGESVTIFQGVELERVPFLVWMSVAFLALVIVNGLFKLFINTAKGRLGERMLRRLRYMLFDRILRFPFAHFRKAKAPELATMIKDEVEPLGGFIGDAYVQPVFLGGQTLTALAFIITQNLWLGLVAGAIALFQAFLIPKLRAPILVLGRERQLTARQLAGRIGESVDGVEQIRSNDTGRLERAEMAASLGRIFWIRFHLYQKKFGVKFINNMLSQLTPFLFYLIGGYLAIKGKLDVGQLVAVIVAYKELPGPMKELIDWDQRRQDTQIKYEQVVQQFVPVGMLDPALIEANDGTLDGPLTISGVTLMDDTDHRAVDEVSLQVTMDESVALTGPAAAPLVEAIARLRDPASGSIRFGNTPIETLPLSVTGREIAYLSGNIYLRGPTVFDALCYPLKRQPTGSKSAPMIFKEARRTGNPADDPDADWIDYSAAGATDIHSLSEQMLNALDIVEMEDDLFRWGLRQAVSTSAHDGNRILRAREAVAERLANGDLSRLVERFDPSVYNGNATVAENLLFGASVDPAFSLGSLHRNPQMLSVLREANLLDPLIDAGRIIAKTLLEIFGELTSGNLPLEQFSFVRMEDLPQLKETLNRNVLTDQDRERLLALAFAYVDIRHRLDVIDDDLKRRVVEARQVFKTKLPTELRGKVAFYDPEKATSGARVLDDILFGRISQQIARARERVEAVIFEALETEELLPVVLSAGLAFDIGSGGRRLTVSQRQRIGIARAMLRRPKLLLMNEALSVIDPLLAERIATRIVGLRQGKATIAALQRPRFANIFTRHVSFEKGRLQADESRVPGARASEPADTLGDEVAALRQIALFAKFDPATLKLIAFASERVTFSDGEYICRQGEAGDRAYVIISGTADVLFDAPGGPSVVAQIGSNEFVGEAALLAGTARSASVRAIGDVETLEITEEFFFRMIDEFPGVSTEIMRELAQRMQRTTAFMAANRQSDAGG